MEHIPFFIDKEVYILLEKECGQKNLEVSYFNHLKYHSLKLSSFKVVAQRRHVVHNRTVQFRPEKNCFIIDL